MSYDSMATHLVFQVIFFVVHKGVQPKIFQKPLKADGFVGFFQVTCMHCPITLVNTP